MESEINSQPEIFESLINKYTKNYCITIDIPLEIKRMCIVASGSSYNAGLLAKYFFEEISQVETNVKYASEISNSVFDNYDKETLYIFISQSGKSEDVVNSFNIIKKTGAKTLSITNNKDSVLFMESDYAFDILAGREYAIAATKTFSASVLMLWIIAIKIAQNKKFDISSETKNIYTLKTDIENSIKDIENLDLSIKLFSDLKNFSIIGLGQYYPIAREAALKIRETCYINTSSYPMGEFVHGHFAVLNKAKVFMTIMPYSSNKKEQGLLGKILSTYKTKSVIITDTYEDYNCDIAIKFNRANSRIVTVLSLIIIIQLIAFRTAIKLKRNVDKPIGLNKVVDNN